LPLRRLGKGNLGRLHDQLKLAHTGLGVGLDLASLRLEALENATPLGFLVLIDGLLEQSDLQTFWVSE